MIGILFLATVVIWLMACIWLAHIVGNLVAPPQCHMAVKSMIFLVFLSLPFVDEVIGKHQFENLCKTNGIEHVDVSKARGKKVKAKYGAERLITNTVMPIHETDVLFSDADTGEVLIQQKIYRASGGWLMRYTWLSMGSNHPMLFPSGCNEFQRRKAIFAKNNIYQIN